MPRIFVVECKGYFANITDTEGPIAKIFSDCDNSVDISPRIDDVQHEIKSSVWDQDEELDVIDVDELLVSPGDSSDNLGIFQDWPIPILDMETEWEDLHSEATHAPSIEDAEFLGLNDEKTLWDDNIYDDPLVPVG
ncbi:hypothetical protein MCOR06_006567 [Pyricularia oryzae]|nr:hypothetical protein MCOR06_006567 [Pyricularia oryzae]